MELIAFAKEIIELCKSAGAKPILHGSLALKYYAKNSNISVHDVDLFISENSFTNVIKLLDEKKYTYKYSKKWHVIEVRKDNLKVDLDSYEYWCKGRDKPKKIELKDVKLHMLTLRDLTEQYRIAAEVSDKIEENRRKYEIASQISDKPEKNLIKLRGFRP